MRRYIHIFFCLTAIISIVGCERSGIIESPVEAEHIMLFNPSVEATRASVTDLTTLQGDGFNIAAFLTDDDNTLYYTDEVKYNSSTTAWASETTRYWSVMNSLDMFAYSPLSDLVAENSNDGYANYSITYTCPAAIDSQIDLLAESLFDQSYDSTGDGCVDLAFSHILSGIKFNVEFEAESNITLNTISIRYIDFDRVRTYNFANETWNASESTYFDSTSGYTTEITVGTTEISSSGSVLFDDIDEQLMIIPQEITDTSFITIQISYTLNSGQDSSEVDVITGVMPLPAPDSDKAYKMGEVYTYDLAVNGEILYVGGVTIEEQEDPEVAYGNIDLGLITVRMTAEEIDYAKPDAVEEDNSSQYYYTTALRIKNLLLDGVRDFVVVGSMGADGEQTLGDGKLGYYGSGSSAFTIGSTLAGGDHLYSVDLRGTYDYPEFQYAAGDDATASGDIAPTDPILTGGLFASVKGINEVILPHGIKAIGTHAFEDCDALSWIYIADILHIELEAFINASSLQVVEGGALTRIHDNGFKECNSLTTIDLSQVSIIDRSAFYDCPLLSDVDLSALTTIGANAFEGCSALTLQSTTSLSLLEEVGSYAFSECVNLGADQELSMPNLVSVGDGAFNGCESINIVSGLSNLTTISNYAFQECYSLTGCHSGSTETLSLPYVTEVGIAGLYGTAITSVSFSDNLTTIDEHAFQMCDDLTSISGLDKVVSVGKYGFYGCSALEELSLPSLTDGNYGRNFFADCSSLKIISLPLITENEIESDSESSNPTIIGMIKTAIERIELPSLSSFDGWQLQSHDNLVYADFSSVVTLEAGAFYGCSALEEVKIQSVESVGDQAFKDCVSLRSIDLSKVTSVSNQLFENCALLGSVYVDKATTVGDNAFSGCAALADIYLPLVESVGSGAFKNCILLEVLDLPLATSVGASAFSGCAALVELRLPSYAVEEGVDYGYWGYINNNYSELKYIDLSAIESFNSGVFAECENLIAVDISGATTLGNQLFDQCEKIERLNLSGLIDVADDNTPFLYFKCGSTCEIWLSDEQYEKRSGNTWQGITWKAIYNESSDVKFDLTNNL